MDNKPTERESKFFLIAMVVTITALVIVAGMYGLGYFGEMVLSFGG